MNILRELRKTSKRSTHTKVRLVLLFSVILIVDTYAWFNIQKEIELKKIEGDVKSWDVSYFINNEEELNENVKFEMAELYPGTNYIDNSVHVYNTGDYNSKLNFEVVEIQIFGEKLDIESLKAQNRIVEDIEQKKGIIFQSDDEEYPFQITYTLDRNELIGKYPYGEYINGKYIDKKDSNGKYGYENGSTSVATLTFQLEWDYISGKDNLDTQLGKKAYEYYNRISDETDKSNLEAFNIVVKLSSEKDTSGNNVTEM